VTEDGAAVRIAVSIGVASYPDMAANMDELVARVEVYWRDQAAPAETGGA
jgi:predicted signal transduction protein with EAL and GGDEF domain